MHKAYDKWPVIIIMFVYRCFLTKCLRTHKKIMYVIILLATLAVYQLPCVQSMFWCDVISRSKSAPSFLSTSQYEFNGAHSCAHAQQTIVFQPKPPNTKVFVPSMCREYIV